ncbi:unnamed protein product [Peniophora sp. CBMAI 1063]|nr:unnamed protein product [Peniophora sp. CBMAI 1063]
MLSLQSLKESSPICPPVQSVVGGLLKLVDTYEIAVQNETDRRRLYERVDAIQGSLEAAWGDTDIREFCLSEVQLAALETLNVNMQSLLGVASQLSLTRIRHWAHRLALRFILARAHKDQITVLHTALAHMDDDFRRTLELDTNRRMNLVQKNINSVLSTSSTNHLALLSEFHRLQTIISIGLAGLFV